MEDAAIGDVVVFDAGAGEYEIVALDPIEGLAHVTGHPDEGDDQWVPVAELYHV